MIGVPEENRPYRIGTRCFWKILPEFRENEGLVSLGNLQQILLNDEVKTCQIDFRYVEWADPQPLLCLGLVLAESKLEKNQIVLNLGSISERHSSPSHRVFLKFLSQQGFLNALGNYVLFRCEGRIQQDVHALRMRLSTEPQATHFQNADCILSRILRVDQFETDHSGLQKLVEELLKEAQDRAVGGAFGAEPRARDMLFQKLRKLLYELLLNIAEHSHQEKDPSYAGIYARIRGPKPPVEEDSKAWTFLFNKTVQTFGQQQFSPNPYAEWLELFVCDVGVGLTAHIADWKEPDDPEVAEDLRMAKKSKNPLRSIAFRLFRNSLSRHPRHDAKRTAVTGLQHLGHLLSIGGDYCRIYTQNGNWIGNRFPWATNYSREDVNTRKEFAGLTPVSGTAYVFSIQPTHYNLSIDQTAWIHPDEKVRNLILEKLRTRVVFAPPVRTEYFDRRTQNHCLPPTMDEFSAEPPMVMVLRPPRLTSKHDISKWLELVSGVADEMPLRPVSTFVLADLTPFQTLAFRELLLNVQVPDKIQLDFYFVSEHWAVSCVSKPRGKKRFEPANENAHKFLCTSKDDFQFSIGDLAVLLRQMDSEIFWQSNIEKVWDPFFNKLIEWHVSKDKKQVISLERYLDFSRALADPIRYRACRRALRRCLALFPNNRPVGADDLVSSLVRDAFLSSYTRDAETNYPPIIVGSVAVTAGTVNRLKEGTDSESIQMMIHGDVHDTMDSKSLAAMLWISQLSSAGKLANLQKVHKNTRPWRRIPNTPYIAPLGEQSVSILRYLRRADGSLDFETPLYGRTPEDTYNDFQRLGILKAGHWKYGSRHDLLTINMRLAFGFSFLELGPLYNWMREQFTLLFSTRNKAGIAAAQLLIYPSHPVTDAMLDRIRQDPGFADILPEGGMIPVKFLGMHTVSPLLASHLVAYQIEMLVKGQQWKEWSAVILDDGAVSGKHMRELTQFLQGLKANTVYTLALLDRTGLPAQEGVFKKFLERHRRLWRWDVPTLGNKRDCTLCQGLAIAQTYSNKLPSERQKIRLEEWIKMWKVLEVDTEWHKGGLQQVPFATPLKVTFGVDERKDGARNEKHVLIKNSTAATSILLELTRLTTRADVTIKKAKRVASANPDAAIEMIACQLMLFLDELSLREKIERYILLLKLIWIRHSTTQAMSLAGLCFTLADYEVLKNIWWFCRDQLLPKKELGNLDAILAVNIIRSRYFFLMKEPYKLPDEAGEIEKHNYILLGGGGGLRQVVRNFLEIYRNPAAPECFNTHTTEMRKRLSALPKVDPLIDISKLITAITLVLQDLRLVEQVMTDIQCEHLAVDLKQDIELLNSYTNSIDMVVNDIKFNKVDSNAFGNNVVKYSNLIYKSLYGDSASDGLFKKATNQFLRYFASADEIDNKLIAKMVRSLRSNWAEIVKAKEEARQNEEAAKRWRRDSEGDIVKPEIFCSVNPELPQVWLYCDSFVNQTLEDTFANVYHATGQINDPWIADETDGRTAHLWWRVKVDGNYAELETANASANRSICLKQTVNIAGLERAGGSIKVEVKDDKFGRMIVYLTLRIPLYSAFIKEKL